MSETVLYLEADDEITSVVRRVRAADADRVIVVVPGRSRATSSAVALRLLARAGEETGREVAIVGDALTRSLAAEAGLAAYASLDDARRADPVATSEPTEVHHAAIHVVRGTEETVVTPAIVAEDATHPVPLVRAADRRSRRRTLIAAIAAVVVVVLVVGLGLVGAALLPGATVTIQPATEAVGPVPYTVGFTEPQDLSGTAEATATVTATGTYDILAPATGTIVLFNWTSFDQPIAAGTLVAAGDQAFETQADIVVPSGSLTTEGTIQAGEAAVGVAASLAGPAGNVGPNEIDTVLSEDADARLQGFPQNNQQRVTNPEATSGGADESGIRFTRADVAAAIEALRADLRGQVADAVPDQADAIVVQPEPAEPSIEGNDGLAGTRDQPEATIEGTLEWEAVFVERDLVIDAAVQRLVDDLTAIPLSHRILEQSAEVMIQEAGVEGVALVVDVTAAARTTPRIDELQVFHRISGLTRDEAEAALADLGDATVELWPDWVASVPTMPWRVEVREGEP